MKTYTFIEATEVLNTSGTTLSLFLVKGKIPAAKFGQEWCIPEETLDAFIRSEVERQTIERIEAAANGKKPQVPTARGNKRNEKPNLDNVESFPKAA